MNYDECGSKECSEAEREKEISREFNRLKNEVAKLNDKIQILVGNLKPIMREQLPECCGDGDKKQSCETDFGIEIRKTSEQLEILSGVVLDVIGRLEI